MTTTVGWLWIPVVLFGAAAALPPVMALLPAALRQRSFGVAPAFSKTEVLRVALLSWALLGAPVGAQPAAAIVVASAGLALLSLPPAGIAAPGT